MSLTSSQMDQTFWGVVSAAVGRLGPWGVHLRYDWPDAFGSAKGTFYQKKKRVLQENENSFFVVHTSPKDWMRNFIQAPLTYKICWKHV